MPWSRSAMSPDSLWPHLILAYVALSRPRRPGAAARGRCRARRRTATISNWWCSRPSPSPTSAASPRPSSCSTAAPGPATSSTTSATTAGTRWSAASRPWSMPGSSSRTCRRCADLGGRGRSTADLHAPAGRRAPARVFLSSMRLRAWHFLASGIMAVSVRHRRAGTRLSRAASASSSASSSTESQAPAPSPSPADLAGLAQAVGDGLLQVGPPARPGGGGRWPAACFIASAQDLAQVAALDQVGIFEDARDLGLERCPSPAHALQVLPGGGEPATPAHARSICARLLVGPAAAATARASATVVSPPSPSAALTSLPCSWRRQRVAPRRCRPGS